MLLHFLNLQFLNFVHFWNLKRSKKKTSLQGPAKQEGNVLITCGDNDSIVIWQEFSLMCSISEGNLIKQEIQFFPEVKFTGKSIFGIVQYPIKSNFLVNQNYTKEIKFSREVLLPRKFDFPGNLTSQEIWLHGN